MSTSRHPRTGRPAPSTAQSVWLVAEREIGSKLRSKAFIISTAILFVDRPRRRGLGRLHRERHLRHPGRRHARRVSPRCRASTGLDVTDAPDRAAAEDARARRTTSTRRSSATPRRRVGFTLIAESSAPTNLLLLLRADAHRSNCSTRTRPAARSATSSRSDSASSSCSPPRCSAGRSRRASSKRSRPASSRS